MKQSLQLRIGQQLTMTPQLQQAIKLLQLSTLELRTEIQQALEANPMLELTDEAENETEEAKEDNPADDPIEVSQEAGEALSDSEGLSEQNDAERDDGDSKGIEEQADTFDMDSVPDELPVDSAWEDVFDNSISSAAPEKSEDRREIDNPDSSTETLREHLLWQMRLTVFTDQDRVIAMAIIDAINERGYLSSPLEEIYDGLQEELTKLRQFYIRSRILIQSV